MPGEAGNNLDSTPWSLKPAFVTPACLSQGELLASQQPVLIDADVNWPPGVSKPPRCIQNRLSTSDTFCGAQSKSISVWLVCIVGQMNPNHLSSISFNSPINDGGNNLGEALVAFRCIQAH